MFPGRHTIHPEIRFPTRGRASWVRRYAFLFLSIFLIGRIGAVLAVENGSGNKSTIVVGSSHDFSASGLCVHQDVPGDEPVAKLANVLEAEELSEGSDSDSDSESSDLVDHLSVQFKSREIVQVNQERSAVFSIVFSIQKRSMTSLVVLHHAWKSFLS